MEFKKFLTAMACLALVLVGALGFAGCDKNASVDEVSTYVASAEVDEAFAKGFKMNLSMTGLTGDMEVYAKYDDNEELTEAAFLQGNTKVYLQGGWLYVSYTSGTTTTKTKCDFTNLSTTMQAYKTTMMNGINRLTNYDKEAILEYLETFEAALVEGHGVKLSVKKEQNGQNVTFKITLSGKVDGTEFSESFNLKFYERTLQKLDINFPGMSVSVESYSAPIPYPADLTTYTDVTPAA